MNDALSAECPIARGVREYARDAAVIDDGRAHSFADYDADIAAATARMDVARGERVGLLARPSYAYLCALWALLRRGAVAVPISTRLPPAGVKRLADELELTALVTDAACGAGVRGSGVAVMELASVCASGAENGARGSGSVRFDVDAPAFIVLTSGSTATPRAVVHSYAGLACNALGASRNMALARGDRWLLSLPLYHVSGIGIVMRAALAGACVVIPAVGDVVWGAMRTDGITHVSVVSTQLAALVAAWEAEGPLTLLKAVLAGGSRLSVALVSRAVALGLPLHVSYGSTELGSQITTSRAGDLSAYPGASGRVLPYREVAISPGGEILARGGTLCLGYLKGGRVCPCVDEQGWFHTGDRGTLDGDGRLTVIGRCDTMFISGGENIYPEEIEDALLAVAGVLQAAVVAVPDATYGERPVAFIRTDVPTGIADERIYAALTARLPRFKLPDRLYPWPADYPAGTIKIDRDFLRRCALRQ